MEREQRAFLRKRPGVDVMHVLDDGNVRDQIAADVVDIQLLRHAFEQDVGRVPHQEPGAAQHQQPDQHGEDRVDRHPSGRHDDQRRADRRHRAQHVAPHVEQGAPYVEVVAIGAVKHRECGDVGREAQPRHRQHGAGQHLRRVQQPVDRLAEDPDADEDEADPVGEGGENGEAVIAVGACLVGRAVAQPEGEPGEEQGYRVDEHMCGIGQQRERPRDHPAGHLGEHEACGQQQRPEDASLIAAVRVAGV